MARCCNGTRRDAPDCAQRPVPLRCRGTELGVVGRHQISNVVAFGQLVPAGPGQIFDPFRARHPVWGANTEFADMRAAYDALDERTKAEVEDIVCEHSLIHSREAIAFNDLTREEIAAFQPVRQPLVRTHPVTGGKLLFLASHPDAIVGWTIPEARMFLRDLTEHATQREFVYAHSWRPHDLVMWDNLTTMHRAPPP